LFSKEIEIGKVSHDRSVRIDTIDGDQVLCIRWAIEEPNEPENA